MNLSRHQLAGRYVPPSGSPSSSRRQYIGPGSAAFELARNAEKCRRSLAQFVRLAWPVVDPAPLVWGWHMDAICEHLQAITQGDIRRLIINIPPGHAKSMIVCVMWPAWEWLVNPGAQSLFGSYDINLALRDSDKCRDIIKSEWYRDLFEPDWRLARNQDAKFFYKNTRSGNRYSFGMNAGGVTGWRGNKVALDDPLSTKNRHNPRVKREVNELFDKVLSTRVNNRASAAFLVIMQRLADDDLTGHLLERGGYDHLCLPGEFEPDRRAVTSIGWKDPRTHPGELLFPALFPADTMDELKLILQEEYAGQIQQRPAPAEGARFRREQFQFWHDHGRGAIRLIRRGGKVDEINLNLCWTFVSVDLAASEEQTADYTVFSTWAVSRTFDLILLDVRRGQWEEPEIIENAVDIYGQERYGGARHTCFVVEDNGLGLPICQAMTASGVPVLSVHIHRTDKYVRSATAAIRMQAGQIFFPDPQQTPWYAAWEKELLLFPNGSHDDQVDTLSLAAEGVYEAGIGGLREAETLPPARRRAHEIIRGRHNRTEDDERNERKERNGAVSRRFFR